MERLSKVFTCVFLVLFLMLQYSFCEQKLNIVATTTDLADLAKNIGGDKVNIICLSKGNQDLHSIEPRPSMVINIKNADMLDWVKPGGLERSEERRVGKEC